MLVLAFDTSSPAVTVAVGRWAMARPTDVSQVRVVPGHGSVAERDVIANNKHGELLAPLITEVLAEAEVTPRDLGAIGVGLGPGPFTGLRVGIVTAKTMGDALGIPTYGRCSLDVIAQAYASDSAPFAVVTDARRKQVYWRTYDRMGWPTAAPELSPPAEVAELLRGQVGEVVGAGAELYRDAFTDFTISDQAIYPRARELVAMVGTAMQDQPPSEDLVPLYLRRPDAQPPGPPKQVTPV